MKLTVVGCSGSYPGPDSPASCYLVECDHEGRTWRILLDLGNGALGQLHRYADPLSIDAVLLSHLHADHCMDMCGYYVMRKYHPSGVQPRLPVWGPSDTAARLARAYDLPEDPGMNTEFEFHTHAGEAGEPVRIGPFTITTTRVLHPVEAYALRVDAGGRSLTYTGDTGECDAVGDLAQGADLLLAEAAFRDGGDGPPDIHLTGSQAGSIAAKAGVGRLVLTHVPPWHDPHAALVEARTTWDGPLDLAVSGAVYDV